MKKIKFENGTLVSNAKVEIGGTIYDVTPEQYEGTTPLSASNMNAIQENAEEAINEVTTNLEQLKADLKPVILWEGSIGGINDTATLLDSVTNYQYILVKGVWNDKAYATRCGVLYPDYQNVGEIAVDWATSTNAYHYGCHFQITDKTFKILNGWAMVNNSSGGVGGQYVNDNQIRITEIVGYNKKEV